MKFFIVIIALVALVQANDWSPKTVEEIKSIRKNCAKEAPANDEEFLKRKENDYPDVESVRNYVLCTAKGWGIYEAGKGYKNERIAEQFKGDLPEDDIKSIVHDCEEKTKEDADDEKAYHILKCLCTSKLGEAIKEFLDKSE